MAPHSRSEARRSTAATHVRRWSDATPARSVWLETGEAWLDSRRGHYIRQYLADAQSGCCAICGGANTWLGLPLALVLDHIDGNPTNNRRENLRLVCPNCDSQLATYKSRNRGNGRTSGDSGTPTGSRMPRAVGPRLEPCVTCSMSCSRCGGPGARRASRPSCAPSVPRPRPAGAAMVVSPDGSVAGSVSGGCVEAAVYELAGEVVQTGRPQLQRYGITDDDAFAVGLTCGGIIDIFAEPVSRETFPQLDAVADDIAAHRPIAVATVIAHPDPEWVGPAARRRRDERRRLARLHARGRRRRRRRPRPARRRSHRRADLRSRRPAPRRGHGGLRRQPRAAAPDDRLRRHRLRRGTDPPGRPPRLPRHGLRRPPRLRDARALPRRRRGRRRLARPLPGRAAGARRDRRPDGRSASSPTTPSSTCRCSRSRCACRGSATSVRWGRARPTSTGWTGCARSASPTPRPSRAVQPDRTRPGRPHARGDRGVDHRRDHRPPLGRRWPSAGRGRRPGSTTTRRKPMH